jgi:Zn ribbon nucleic-acid-binding protein
MEPNGIISNDFGVAKPDIVVLRNPFDRGLVEQRSAISIFELTRSARWKERTFSGLNEFKLGDTEVQLVQPQGTSNWCIDLLNYGPKNTCGTIWIVTTKCRYGGGRQWFECPGCKKRAAILYREEDDFRCRKCLKLGYYTHTMNYRGIEPAIRNMKKVERMNEERRRISYGGKHTKWMQRYEKLKASSDFGLDLYGARYLNE